MDTSLNGHSPNGHDNSDSGPDSGPGLTVFEAETTRTLSKHGQRLAKLESGLLAVQAGVEKLNNLVTVGNLSKLGAAYVLVEIVKVVLARYGH